MKPLEFQPGRGALFEQYDKKNDRAPDFKGGINIGGVQYELSAWRQTSKRGTAYLSVSLSKPRDEAPAGAAATGADMDRAFKTNAT